MKTKRALIGLDAAELTFIEENLESLPTLARCFSEGAVSRLQSTARHMSGSVHPTFFTGQSPGEHGMYHHLQWDATAMQMRRVRNDWLPNTAFWRGMDEQGLRVIAFDVQMLSPKALRNGIEVVSWGSHDQLTSFQAYPGEVGRDLFQRFGNHPMGAEIPVNKTPTELKRIKKNLIEGATVKGRACQYLAQTHPWDLFVTAFGELHRGGHIFWPESDKKSAGDILEIYQAVDHALGDLLEIFRQQGAPVTLFALHGMGFNTSQEHFMAPVMQRANAQYLEKSTASPSAPAKFPLIRLLRERVPASLQNGVAHIVPVKVRDWVVSRQTISGLDWETTPGFALLADLHGYIRLNLRGREADGYFEPDSPELGRYVEWLERCLRSLRRRPDGQPLVAEVVRAREVYPGLRLDFLPDLFVVWNALPSASHIDSDLLGEFEAQLATGRSGNHRPDGFVVIPAADTALQAAARPRAVEDLAALFSAGYEAMR